MDVVEDKLSDHSEDENEMNIINTNKFRKKNKVINSDSENEDLGKKSQSPPEGSTLSNAEIPETVIGTNKRKKLKRISVMNSDSEDENNVDHSMSVVEKSPTKFAISSDEGEETSVTVVGNNKKKKLKRISVMNSDAEEEKNVDDSSSIIEEEEVTIHNKSFMDETEAVEAIIYSTNSKGELIPENKKKANLESLYDSESSEEEREQNDDIEKYQEEQELQPKVYKRPTKRNKEDKPQKMTVQEAAKQKSEIFSESQRMLRESNISLPYHKPKSYTIKEFLERRAKLALAVPLIPKAPPSVAMKMTKDLLEEVSKKLDERCKEVEEFYKSESEEEDDNTEETSKEIKSWLNSLLDTAMDTVENKLSKLIVEESTEAPQEENKLDKSDSLDQEELIFNLDDIDEENPKKSNTSELIKDKLNIQPRLSGTPDDIIDLDEGVTKPSEVRKLVEKFFQHTTKKISTRHKVHLDVVGVGAGGEIIKETVSMNVDEEEESALVETPGAKLQKLREELQQQISQKRLEMWKQKQEQGDILIIEKKVDEDGGKTEKNILDDDEEEEYEMTESDSDDEDDDEEEEEYDLKPEKPKVKSAFIDEEAEEDDVEQMSIDEDDDDNQVEENDGDIDESPENEEIESTKKKVLKRILKPFTEDSDEEEEAIQNEESSKVVKYYTEEDDRLPPNLPRTNITPQRPQLEKNKSEFDFLTPVTYLTGLENLNSGSKFKDSPNLGPSPVKEVNSSKNLFSENSDLSQETLSQDSVEQLSGLCSGKFSEELPPTTQELLNVCSGDFSTIVETGTDAEKQLITENEEKESVEELDEELPPTTQELLNVCSGDFSTMVETGTDTFKKPFIINTQLTAESEIKSLDDDQDQIISQLLDEDELERFKKKFESPVNPTVHRKFEEVDEVNATGLINSDDETEELEVTKKKRQKKLVFSDDEQDEDDDEPELEDDEEIDLHDNAGDDEEQDLENEIAAQESANYKPSDFLENEAELSESEWGSADEDEKDLDDLEFEQGDEETFNEKKMRAELERIHMRQLLDEDNREVKILQELLLEDGELHGTGRKRQFRWRALDSQDNGEFDKRDDDDIFLDEEESEENYRKMRHKREMFLKKKLETVNDDDSILSDSQILKVGQQILKTKSSSSQNNTPTNKTEECKEPFSLLSKRGSFLTRSDQVLQRLAEYNKITTTVGSTNKNSKCFVFQTVETSETTVVKENNKRKATEGTPNVIKKLRLNDLSPAVGKKQPEKSSRAKQLFGNW